MQDYPMGFDWIFFAIVGIPVLFALWELARTWNVKPPRDIAPRR